MSDEKKTVLACPECDKVNDLKCRAGGPGPDPTDEKRWLCSHCGATFDEPNRRPAHRNTGPSAAAILARHGLEPINAGDE